MSVRLDELTWPEVGEVLKKPNAIILPIGSLEEHGYHLPLNFDAASATYIAEQAAKKVTEEHRTQVLVAPTIHYGEVAVRRRFPGTVGLSAETLINVVKDVVRGFIIQGFKNIIIANGHMENVAPIQIALGELNDEFPKAGLFAAATFRLGFDVVPKLLKAGPAGRGHALEVETALAMAFEPQCVHLDRTVKGSLKLPPLERYIGDSGGDETKVFYYPRSRRKGDEKSGIFGDPTMATRESGEAMLAAIVDDLADIVVRVLQSEE